MCQAIAALERFRNSSESHKCSKVNYSMIGGMTAEDLKLAAGASYIENGKGLLLNITEIAWKVWPMLSSIT